MVLYCIHAHDNPGAAAKRAEHYPAHRAFLANSAHYGVEILASGPLVSDDGTHMIGSLLLVTAATREHVEAFSADDPFRKAGLWADVKIDRFNLRVGSIGAHTA